MTEEVLKLGQELKLGAGIILNVQLLPVNEFYREQQWNLQRVVCFHLMKGF